MDRLIGLCPRGIGNDHQKFRDTVGEFEAQFPDDPPDQVRLAQLVLQLNAANALDPGDYIELGVFRGMTLKVIYRYMDKDRSLYGLDTFAGFDERDIASERLLYKNAWTAGNFAPTSPSEVARYVGNGKHPPNLFLMPGWFPDSYAGCKRKRWRFAHVDMDLFDPTYRALETLWPQMVPGGIIMVHDYGCPHFRARYAVDRFCQIIELPPVELPDRYSTAVIRKPWK